MTENTTTIATKCPQCGSTKDFVLPAGDVVAWKTGVYVQVAFPYLSADDRERLVTGICGPCFDALFADDDDG